MTSPAGEPRELWEPVSIEPVDATDGSAVLACCSALYGDPFVEVIVGDSLHPGGLDGTRQLLEASALRPGQRLLDAGCGLGASARVAAAEFGLRVDAVDADAAVLGRAEARATEAPVRWHRADLCELPFDDATFEGVLTECVLSTTRHEDALAELRRVLRPGGVVVMSDVETDGQPIAALAGHRLLGAALCITDAWRPGELSTCLGAAGFRLERRWDRSAAILALLDRVEGRLAIARSAARTLGLDPSTLAGTRWSDGDGDDPARLRGLANDVRDAVARGSLRYFACVAVADGPAGVP